MEQNELRALEDQCIQECAPACQAACPIHIDVRALTREISRGDFAAARKVLTVTLPFPGIISRICDSPCQSVCKRNDAGGSIAINTLERASVNFGGLAEDKPRMLPKRGKRVAVVGGGISGLTAAYDLTRKGYDLVIFEANARLGGNLWKISRDALPEHVILDDLARVTGLGVEVRCNTPVNRLGLNGSSPKLVALRGEFDAVYLAFGAFADDTFELARDAQGRIHIDPATFATSMDGVFAGGGLLWGIDWHSSVESISEGRRAAISIDRYLQRVSLTASRVNEGAYATRLYTDTRGVPARPMVEMDDPADGYERHEAIQEAQRCLQCECMECVRVCEYLRSYGGYPRKYVRQVYNNLSIVKGTRHANKFINSCSLCGLCEEVCPEHLAMGAVNQQARREMVRQNRMPASAHDFALRDMEFSQSDRFAMARHAPGATTSEYVFFPGCQLAASLPDAVERVYADLRRLLAGPVGLMLGCCGAPADWAGRDDLFRSALADWRDRLESLGRPEVILACSSCYQVLSKNLPDVGIISLWELLDQLNWPAAPSSSHARPAAVAIHDPCTTRHQSRLQDSVRVIVRRLGYPIEELALSRDKTACCSYGGVMWLANPELAGKVVERRVGESSLSYVTYCAMCRDLFAAHGKPTRHLLELIYDSSAEGEIRAGPTWSQRRENRARLKHKLLAELWGEPMAEPLEFESIRLVMSEKVRQLLEKRLILAEDIQRTIAHAEKTGSRFLNGATGHFLAHHKPTGVTFWVEYSRQEDGFVVHNAYSHRMELVEDTTT